MNAALRRRTNHRTGARHRLVWLLAAAWFVCLTPLIAWGLPSRHADHLLFAGDAPWPAERLNLAQALAERSARSTGADTDLNPLADRSGLVDLTADDSRRAEILRRYRLFSRQPDEMITLMALQRMRPAELDFDPHLYQYGGAFIYAVGAALGIAGATGLATLTGDASYYLDHPEAFARFYLVARLLVALASASALVAAHRIGRAVAGPGAGWCAAILLALCPVFISGALEAKPHAPSVAAALWAIAAAIDFARRGSLGAACRLGIASGLAFGLVLTGACTALLWPAAALARRKHAGPAWWRRWWLAGLLAVAVYVGSNFYFVRNLLTGSDAVHGNLGNSLSMYTVDRIGEGALRVAALLLEGSGPVAIVGGVTLLIWLLRRPHTALLVAAPALGMLMLAVAIGAGKPAEFARFLLLPTAVAALAIGWATHAAFSPTRSRRRPAASATRRARLAVSAVGMLSVLTFATGTVRYVRAFTADASGARESRRLAATWIEQSIPRDAVIGVVQEPAPFSLPPLAYAVRRVVLVGAESPEAALPEWIVATADRESNFNAAPWRRHYRVERRFADESRSPITWANKPVYVFRRTPARSGIGWYEPLARAQRRSQK